MKNIKRNSINSRKSKYFFGKKNSEIVDISGLGYREFMLMLEWDDDVESYFQPELEIVLEAVHKSLKIDFWVVRKNNITELVHLCTGEDLDNDLLRGGFERAIKLNCVFKVARISEFINCQRLRNIESLYDFNGDINLIYLSLLETFMKSGLPKKLLNLKRVYEFNGLKPEVAYTLIFHRIVEVDLEQPISDETIFSLNPDFILPPLDEDRPVQTSFLDDF